MELKDFIPPIIRRVSSRRSLSPLTDYESYDKALHDTDTYEDPGIIEVVSLKTKAYKDALTLEAEAKTVSNRQTIQNLFALSHVEPQQPLCVLELGGACGASFFELNHLLPERIGQWSIVETPSMAEAGRKLFEDHKLKFFDDLTLAARSLEHPDLIIAQGVLQYSGNPLETLARLVMLGFKHLYITRTVVRVCEDFESAPPIFTRQVTDLSAHGPGAMPRGFRDRKSAQPLTIVTKASLASGISKDYQTLFWFDESEPSRMLIGSRTITTAVVGFLATSR